VKKPRRKAGRLQVMLHQPRNIVVVFQYKNGLAQPLCPRPAAVEVCCEGRTESLTE
jgi:hypothetical protein